MRKIIFTLLILATFQANAQFNKKTSTGSMKQGANLLILNEAMNLKVGDHVTVWIQDPEHSRGTGGPEGAWPNHWYSSKEAMDADNSQPDGLWAFVEGRHNIYRSQSGKWIVANDKSFDASIPKSLSGKVIKITNSDRYVYLDKTAVRSVTNVRVTPDNTNALLDYVIKNRVF